MNEEIWKVHMLAIQPNLSMKMVEIILPKEATHHLTSCHFY